MLPVAALPFSRAGGPIRSQNRVPGGGGAEFSPKCIAPQCPFGRIGRRKRDSPRSEIMLDGEFILCLIPRATPPQIRSFDPDRAFLVLMERVARGALSRDVRPTGCANLCRSSGLELQWTRMLRLVKADFPAPGKGQAGKIPPTLFAYV